MSKLHHPRFGHHVAQLLFDGDWVPDADDLRLIGSPTIGLAGVHIAGDFLLKEVAADRLGLYNSAGLSKQKFSIGTVLTMLKATIDETVLYVTGDAIQIGTTNLAPRLFNYTTAERNALTPVDGMMIYNETSHTINVYFGGGVGWLTLVAGP